MHVVQKKPRAAQPISAGITKEQGASYVPRREHQNQNQQKNQNNQNHPVMNYNFIFFVLNFL